MRVKRDEIVRDMIGSMDFAVPKVTKRNLKMADGKGPEVGIKA